LTKSDISCLKCEAKFSINENLIESDHNTFPFKQIIDAIAVDGNPYFSKCPECGLKVVFAGYKRQPERTDPKEFGL